MSQRVGAKTKGWVKNINNGSRMFFQFNPENLSYSRGATYSEISSPGMNYPLTQYVRGNSRSFPSELFLYDKPYTGSINKYITFFESLLPPEVNSINFFKPPELLFCYGTFIKRCVLESMDVVIEESDPSGRPLQAKIKLQLRQVKNYNGSLSKF